MVSLLDLPNEVISEIVTWIKRNKDTFALLRLSVLNTYFRTLMNGKFWYNYFQEAYRAFPETNSAMFYNIDKDTRMEPTQACLPLPPNGEDDARTAVVRALAQCCHGCAKLQERLLRNALERVNVCTSCAATDRWCLITTSEAKKEYHLTEGDLEGLPFHKTVNPHHHKFAAMKLYPLHRVKEALRAKVAEKKKKDEAKQAKEDAKEAKAETARIKRREKLKKELDKNGYVLDEEIEEADIIKGYLMNGRPAIKKVLESLTAIRDDRDLKTGNSVKKEDDEGYKEHQ